MHWACCYLPSLSLEVFESTSTPRIVIDGPAQRAWVHAASSAALALGVRPGQTLAAAHTISSDIDVKRRDVSLESSRLQLLALHAYSSSPQVVLMPPDVVLLEVGACLKLFGGWPAIRQRLRQAFIDEGHTARIALAPTPLAAQLLATLKDDVSVANKARLADRLDGIAISDAQLDKAHYALLADVGIRRLGEARRLPSSSLARRAGRELITHLQRLYGESADPQTFWQPPPRIELACEFEYGIDNSQALRFPLQRLTRELTRHLHARDCTIQRFELRFGHEGQPPTALAVGLRTPLRQADALFDSACVRLDQAQLPAPAHRLSLIADDLLVFSPPTADLFDTANRGSLDWKTLTERLSARLGDSAVSSIAAWPDHRPEHAWRRSASPSADPMENLPPRPTWLLPKPQPLSARIVAFIGSAERIESGWWDGQDARRDYVIADLDTGQRAWLFREVGSEDTAWRVHGWFA